MGSTQCLWAGQMGSQNWKQQEEQKPFVLVKTGLFLRVSTHPWEMNLGLATGPKKTRASCKLGTRHTFWIGMIMEISTSTYLRGWHSLSVTVGKSSVLVQIRRGVLVQVLSPTQFQVWQRKYLLSSQPRISPRVSGVIKKKTKNQTQKM